MRPTSPCSPCVTNSKTTTIEEPFHPHAIGHGGETVMEAEDAVSGSRSKQVDTVNVVSFDPK